MARPRKPPRKRAPRAPFSAVLADPEAHTERNRRFGDNIFLAFVVFWALVVGSMAVIWLMRGR